MGRGHQYIDCVFLPSLALGYNFMLIIVLMMMQFFPLFRAKLLVLSAVIWPTLLVALLALGALLALARSLANIILILTCSLAHWQISSLFWPARSLIQKNDWCTLILLGARGARSLVDKFDPYFDLLARSFRKYDRYISCSLAHWQILALFWPARSLVQNLWNMYSNYACSLAHWQILAFFWHARSLIQNLWNMYSDYARSLIG